MRKLLGKVLTNKMDKTVVVGVSRWLVHPIYKKRFLRHKKYHVHSLIEVKIGDQVEIVETRPMSKTKRWRITKII